jgi:hypothetical protein
VVGNALNSATTDRSGGQSGKPPARNVELKTIQCNNTPGVCEVTQNFRCTGLLVACGDRLSGDGETILCKIQTVDCDAKNISSANVSMDKCGP